MSDGKTLFRKFRLFFVLIIFSLRLLPRFFSEFLWGALKPASNIFVIGLRYCLACRLSRKCGDNVYFGSNVVIKEWKNLSFGSNVSVHDFCYLDASGTIEIGNNVSIAHSSSLLSFEHTWSDMSTPIRDNPISFKNLSIDDDVWIGCGVRVLAGVTISSRCVIAAGAVLNRSTEPNTILAGVPAKVIKFIGDL